jgi:lysophospholipase L1-like esterase
MNSALLNMDVERLIVVVLFFIFLYIFLKFLLFITKTAKYRVVKFLSQGILLCTIIVLLVETVVRFSYFLYYKEVNFLVYPFRAFTRDYMYIQWTPQYYLTKKPRGLDGEIANIPTVISDYRGLNYIKAIQNASGFRYNPKYTIGDGADVNVVTLGGSSTWGFNVEGQTYPDYLQNFLGEKFRVFNLGRLGYNTISFIGFLKGRTQLTKLLKIDIAILYIGHNDTQSHHKIFSAWQRLKTAFFYQTEKFPLIKYSLLARNLSLLLFSTEAKAITNDLILKESIFDGNRSKKAEQDFETRVVNIISFLKTHNKDIKILLVPEYINYYMSSLEFRNYLNEEDFVTGSKKKNHEIINYDFYLRHKSLEKVAKQFPENVHFIDIDFFAPYSPKELLMDTVHLYPKGNKILARNIAEYINKIQSH